MVRRVIIYRHPDGSIRNPSGIWTHFEKNMYYDGFRFLIVNRSSPPLKETCPFKIHDVETSIISLSSRYPGYIITSPISHRQFSLLPVSQNTSCSISSRSYTIHHTPGGYLISISVGNRGYLEPVAFSMRYLKQERLRTRRPRSPAVDPIIPPLLQSMVKRQKRSASDIYEFAENLRTDFDYAQYRYEQEFVTRQINKNLVLLQKSVCEIKYTKWLTLTEPYVAGKVAEYVTGSIYAVRSY